MNIREQIVAEAESWLGTPYHHAAEVKGAGTDCGMLLVAVYRTCGVIPAIDPRPYPQDWHLHRSEERYLGWVRRFGRETDSPQAGDVAVYRFGRTFSHGGILTGTGELIHAYVGRGVVRDELDTAELAGRDVRFFSLIED
ncbi:MAG: NlpC/P60 family protein [Neisseria sp.]|nr:NlpC/P60 family protein [Neisseria sp.]